MPVTQSWKFVSLVTGAYWMPENKWQTVSKTKWLQQVSCEDFYSKLSDKLACDKHLRDSFNNVCSNTIISCMCGQVNTNGNQQLDKTCYNFSFSHFFPSAVCRRYESDGKQTEDKDQTFSRLPGPAAD